MHFPTSSTEQGVECNSPSGIRDCLVRILTDYGQNRTEPLVASPLARFMRRDVPDKVRLSASLNEDKYTVWASPGRGNWAEIPWICIFDTTVTETAQKGMYIVYLFRADLSGVYLSLNQGYTYFKRRFGVTANSHIKKVAEYCRLTLSSSSAISFDAIDLRGNGELARGYQDGSICGLFYNSSSIPNERRLVDDLRVLLGIYAEAVGKFGGRAYTQFVSDVLNLPLATIAEEKDDTEFQRQIDKAMPSNTTRTPHERLPMRMKNGRPEWPRDPSVSKERMIQARYRCEVNENHKTFVSDATGENFVESHHLIPMRAQTHFDNSLDVPGNIVCLCPTCHRLVHHGRVQDRIALVAALVDERLGDLHAYGLQTTPEEVYVYYR